MLQFILPGFDSPACFYPFQYISCCSLSPKSSLPFPFVPAFQYISCCSLSVMHTFKDYVVWRFNTSHVVVYPDYCSLSAVKIVFQYISCCSLSLLSRHNLSSFLCFNTSHVVVYRRIPICTIMTKSGFNTSHVVVYHGRPGKSGGCYFVSIHLMLQFIRKLLSTAGKEIQFQYISCCSLSFFIIFSTAELNGFNTSHVVVYLESGSYSYKIQEFQYISCCSLSNYVFDVVESAEKFQYISCCSLSETGRTMKGWLIIVSIHLMLQFIVFTCCQ